MNSNLKYAQKKFWFKLKLVVFIIATWWFVAVFNLFLGISVRNFAIQPHAFNNILGIFTYPFIHGSLDHLLNNSLSAFMIFSALFLIYEKLSIKTLLLIYIFSGVLLWFIGESGSYHVGASSVIYGVAFFITVSGFIIRESANIAMSFLLVAWYGSMIWGIFPFSVEDGVSWEGHLAGTIVGVFLAFYYHKDILFKEKDNFNLENDLEDFHFFEKYPLE